MGIRRRREFRYFYEWKFLFLYVSFAVDTWNIRVLIFYKCEYHLDQFNVNVWINGFNVSNSTAHKNSSLIIGYCMHASFLHSRRFLIQRMTMKSDRNVSISTASDRHLALFHPLQIFLRKFLNKDLTVKLRNLSEFCFKTFQSFLLLFGSEKIVKMNKHGLKSISLSKKATKN